MIYHALLMVNHQAYGMLVETSREEPHPAVLRHTELAAEVRDYSKIRVYKDRGHFFAPHHTGGPYDECELVKWTQRGCSALDWQDVLQRKPLVLPVGVPEI